MEEELIDGSRRFALRVMRLVRASPKSSEATAIKDQTPSTGPSVHANSGPSCKARSGAEFISKLGTVAEEADATAGSVELLIKGQILPEKRLRAFLTEPCKLRPIFAALRKTAAHNQQLQIRRRARPRSSRRK